MSICFYLTIADSDLLVYLIDNCPFAISVYFDHVGVLRDYEYAAACSVDFFLCCCGPFLEWSWAPFEMLWISSELCATWSADVVFSQFCQKPALWPLQLPSRCCSAAVRGSSQRSIAFNWIQQRFALCHVFFLDQICLESNCYRALTWTTGNLNPWPWHIEGF